ncbi:hypothetical protein VT84_03615 [Gemmata sp. SH-PL17]|uniref:hypothetical protein n=1 Tax=Gemmata sp. SH-PL17 TaxID=1630693 RepID=UPI00078CBB6F|nr:hypothetical protein [Gemmata sp. SH-PL17]AMV23471.1 hypothetical protein VT84_03615 [Gemmata sp. SH-PL17]
MPKPFDATLKELISSYPEDWLTQLGVPVTDPPEVLSADLSTVTASADTLLKVGDLVVHIDVESGPDDFLARRMLLYNVLAHHHTGLPVRSIVVLLRSKAVGSGPISGVEYAPAPGSSELRFRFETVRAWELPAEDLLKAGVGFLPLAVLGKPPPGKSREQALRGVVEQIAARAEREAKSDAGMLLTASYILCAMHIAPEFARGIFNKVIAMQESGTYQLILEEGAVKHMRELILRQGSTKLGAPTEKQKNKLATIEDLDRLDRIVMKVLSAKDWDALLKVQ